jgi:hypothetical protein
MGQMDYLISEKLRLQQLSERDKFIIKYKAADRVGLSREQFAAYVGMIPDSVMRKRLKISDSIGLELPILPLTDESDIDIELLDKFESVIEEIEGSNLPERIPEYEPNKTYIISCAQNATPVNEEFLAAIETYAEVNDAEILLIPLRYRNPTSIWTDDQKSHEWWDSRARQYMKDYSRRLGKSLEYMGHIKIQPTAIRPLSGFEGYTGTSSAIFAHTKVQLKSIATPSESLPKLLTTTGAITQRNYTDSKAGHKGSFHHSFAALVVEIDSNGHHHLRHVHWNDKLKGFYDLDSFYGVNSHSTGHRAKALITGDTHAEFLDKDVRDATYDSVDSLSNFLKPEYRVFHDIIDFYPRNHHAIGDDILSVGKHKFGRNNVEEGLQCAATLLDEIQVEGTTDVISKSNHDEAFDRWLQRKDVNGVSDPENATFFHYMKYNQLREVTMTATGFKSFDPFAWWCKNPESQPGLSRDDVVFLMRDESFQIMDIEVAFHGDGGPNGARGSIINFSKIGPKTIIGHSHTPGIEEGAYQVGLSARKDLDYASGPSSWMHTHCIIYPDGSRTLIHIIDGKYRA